MTKELKPHSRRMGEEEGSDQEQKGRNKFMVNVRERCWWGINLWLKCEGMGTVTYVFIPAPHVDRHATPTTHPADRTRAASLSPEPVSWQR